MRSWRTLIARNPNANLGRLHWLGVVAQQSKQKRRSRNIAIGLVALVLLGLLSVGVSVGLSSSPTTTTTTTTVPLSRPEKGWIVASSSARGVMVDYTNIDEDGAVFRVLRLRARTTLLRWHDGTLDPPSTSGEVPLDAGGAIDWSNEGPAGVVAVFNGGFKKAADAGGAVVDGVTLEPLVAGDMTIVLSAQGHWSMGVWGSRGFPAKGFDAIAYRQNLGPLILGGKLSPTTAPSDWARWGSPLNNDPLTSRSGIGIDKSGNLIYAGAIGHVDVAQLADALQRAGAVTAMQLDINPFWPVLGASRTPLHGPGALPVQLPNAEHSPSIYFEGWERDFFVALAEPDPWGCFWTSSGLQPGPGRAQPQALHLEGRRCNPSKKRTQEIGILRLLETQHFRNERLTTGLGRLLRYLYEYTCCPFGISENPR